MAPAYRLRSCELPDGQISCVDLQLSHRLSSPCAKNISVFQKRKSDVYPAPSRTPQEGRCASSRTLGAGCGGRGSTRDECVCPRTAKSCGPDIPTLMSSSQGDDLAGDGGKKARSPGRARYKPLKPLRGECRVKPV